MYLSIFSAKRSQVTVDFFNYRMTLIYANGRKLVLNRLSPIGLLPGVSLAGSYCQKVEIYSKSREQSNHNTPTSLVTKILQVLN